jgi:phosphatidylserine/phosphatidylglycerophosphate/cardiolipin synthase-like enzyme
VFGLENPAGTPVYVHAKACVIDDDWATVGSDNLNLRSWTYDSELSCAVLDREYAQGLRLRLLREHLEAGPDRDAELLDPRSCVAACQRTADALQAWHDGGRRGARPPGRLRAYAPPPLNRWSRLRARLVYRRLCDPDGRPVRLRRRDSF